MKLLPSELERYFRYLETEFGFQLHSFNDQPYAFDNFQAEYERPPAGIRITRDRGQVFVELRHGDGTWHDKDQLLEKHGVTFDRFPMNKLGNFGELWSGYEIQNQSGDLKQYLPMLLEHLAQDAQQGAQADALRTPLS